MVTIIIVNYNLSEHIENLLNSIFFFVNNLDYTIVVVDNNSPDRSIEKIIPNFPEVNFELLNTNYGFGHANNYAMNKYESKYYMFLNPDSLLIENSIFALYQFLETHPKFGIVGNILEQEDGTVQESALKFPNIKQELFDIFGFTGFGIRLWKKIRHRVRNESYYETDFVSGACMMIRNEIFKKLGGFDEDYFLFSEETDLCYRVKKKLNYKVGFLRTTKMIHSGGAITNKIKSERIKRLNESKLLFFTKNYSTLKVIILRFLKVLSFGERIVLVVLKKKREDWKEYISVYMYLINYYLIGQPIINKKYFHKKI